MFKICMAQLHRTFRCPRFYIAAVVGCIMQIISILPLARFAKSVGAPLCVFEGFVYLNCDTFIFSASSSCDQPFFLRSRMILSARIIFVSSVSWRLCCAVMLESMYRFSGLQATN